MRTAHSRPTLPVMTVVASALADTWGMHDTGTGWWVVMLVSMLAFGAVVAFGAVWLFRQPSARSEPSSTTSETPREILDRRVATGEITPAEYQHRRSLIEDKADRSAD